MTKTVTTGKATDLITFSRSSTGTYLDSVKYGDELVTNGGFNSASSWSIHGADASSYFGNNKAYVESAGSNAYIVQQLTGVTAGKVYRLSFNLISEASSEAEDGLAYVRFAGVDIALPTGQRQLGAQSYIFTAGSASQDFRFMTYAHDGASFTIDSVSVVEIIGNQGTSGEPLLRTADTNEPRIEYDANGNLKGLLIEEQRANSLTYSEAFTPNWSAIRATISATDETAPDGTTGVKKIIPNTNNLNHYVYQAYSAGTHTWTVFAKAAEYGRISLWEGGVTAKYASFDLRSGTILSSNADSKSITPYGNGWYRCSITVTVASGTPYFLIAALNDTVTSHSQSFEGDDVSGTYIWGAQLEAGTFPTSYIPTSGSTVSRTSDIASLNASLFEYNGNEGTTLIEFDKANWAYTTTFPRVYSWGHGSQSVDILNEVYNYGNSATNSGKIRFRVDDSSGNAVFGANFINGSESDNTAKVALAIKDNDMAIAWKGTVPHTDTTGSPAIDLVTELYIGSKFGEQTPVVNDFMCGHIKSIKYYPVRLTNDEIKALTL